MREYQTFIVDAFTQRSFTGNPAGVVLAADTLSDAEMQSIARELRHSETAFVLKPLDATHAVHIRYFTPTIEVPICGHATIAAHYAMAVANARDCGAITQRSKAGLQVVEVERAEGNDYRVVMRQGIASFGHQLTEVQVAKLCAGLGIAPSDLVEKMPVQIVGTGHPKVIVPLGDHVNLNGISPDENALTELSREIGCNGYYPFQLRGHGTEGRMFAPAIGIPEDPVTGNANGPLGAYLAKYGLLSLESGRLEFVGHQGGAVGRAGSVGVTVEQQASGWFVSIAGRGVIILSGRITLA